MTTRKPKPQSRKGAKTPKVDSSESRRRFWITFPPARIQSPVIWELGHRFPLVTNIRQASITEEVGIVCLEVSGPADSIHEGLRWLKRMGISVEPVELSAVES
ncbi:MAG: NIL domain-containing protein [Verrucomicrobiota bacterium]